VGSHRITLVRGDVVALGTPRRVAVGDHVTCTVEEAGALRNQVIAEPGAGDLLLQLLEEPDWRHGERETSSDDR
jgi:Fumarylacetoacetate (FAA) hydrolase family